MRIGVIQAGSQTDKNNILYETVLRNAKQHNERRTKQIFVVW